MTLLIMYMLACLFIYTIGSVAYHSFFTKVFNKIFTYYFVEDVNSWMRGNHDFQENSTTNSNDSTVDGLPAPIYSVAKMQFTIQFWPQNQISGRICDCYRHNLEHCSPIK